MMSPVTERLQETFVLYTLIEEFILHDTDYQS